MREYLDVVASTSSRQWAGVDPPNCTCMRWQHVHVSENDFSALRRDHRAKIKHFKMTNAIRNGRMVVNDAVGPWRHLSRLRILPSPRRIITSDYSHPVYPPPPSPRLRRQRVKYLGAACLLPPPLASCGYNSVVNAREMAYNFPGVPATAMPPMGERSLNSFASPSCKSIPCPSSRRRVSR